MLKYFSLPLLIPGLLFAVRFCFTWNAIRDVRLGLLPRSTNKVYLRAYTREYCRREGIIDLTEWER